MSNDSTFVASLGAARDAIAVLNQYATHFPELPQPYIGLHQVVVPGFPVRLELQVHIDAFEPWREALGLDPMLTCLYSVGVTCNIEVSGIASVGVEDRVVEVPVHLYATGLRYQEQRPNVEVVSS